MKPFRGRITSSLLLGSRLSQTPTSLAATCRDYTSKKKKRPRGKGAIMSTLAPEVVDYETWSKESLIQKLRETEARLARDSSARQRKEKPGWEPSVPAPRKQKKAIDPSHYKTRFIALKIAYLGKNYGAFEYATSAESTIETELWKALIKTCLIFPKDENVVDFMCCEYSKCGRTDRGVSAFGQVIALRLRSAEPSEEKKKMQRERAAAIRREKAEEMDVDEAAEVEEESEIPFDPIEDEFCYPKLLNKVLPPDIRILAWNPNPPADFSARHSCRGRQYRYFFTQPAMSPVPPALGQPPQDGEKSAAWLDLDAMSKAAKMYEGTHDFRNFCKIDPGKAMTNFTRRIVSATIEEVKDAGSALPYITSSSVDGPNPKVYCFKVQGTAFLWHQIRHMISLLFLVAQGLEKPEVVSQLLDAKNNPRRPMYNMAAEIPLVLWDCTFFDADGTTPLPWIYVNDDRSIVGLTESTWSYWREKKMDEILATGFMNIVTQERDDALPGQTEKITRKLGPRLFEGGNVNRLSGKYVPVLQRRMIATVEDQNMKFAVRKGFVDAADMKRQRILKYREIDKVAAAEGYIDAEDRRRQTAMKYPEVDQLAAAEEEMDGDVEVC